MRAEGHQIGNHTYDHAPLDRLSCGEAMADLSRCDGVLQELAGEGTYWVRPPYGFITEEELAAWSTPMLYWSVDTCDWECRDVQKVFAAICQARDGDVILLHDCYGTSVEAALQAIDCSSEQGGNSSPWRSCLLSGADLPRPGICTDDPSEKNGQKKVPEAMLRGPSFNQ
ncbi:MAG: polysaccharide deacetylase family protein [Dysosmobacter sp.]